MTLGERRLTASVPGQTVETKQLLETVLASRPGMRQATGDVAVEGDEVVVRFPEPEEPPLRPVENRDVACVLYPPS